MSEAADPVDADPPGIPVTVLGGYLGSGKTTMVNHLLRTAGERLAVLVNDFGEIDLDTELIEADDGDTITLANGCICCSLVDGLAAALETVRSLHPTPDRLVIEASGVADPASVAAYGHAPGMHLDAVIVTADLETIRARAADPYVGDTVLQQLRAGDIVVLNKADLVDAAQVDAVRRWLGPHTNGALVVEAINAEVDVALLFGRIGRIDRGETGRSGTSRHTNASGQSTHSHADELYQAWTWSQPAAQPLRRSDIARLMQDLPESVVRAKGILWIGDDHRGDDHGGDDHRGDDHGGDGSAVPLPHVLQRVGTRWSLRPHQRRSEQHATGDSRLVVIGLRGALSPGWLDDRLPIGG